MLRLVVIAAVVLSAAAVTRYTPDWPSLESRPLPGWYDDVKVGIFLHYGVFSVPAFGKQGSSTAAEWFQLYWERERVPEYVDFMKANYPPNFTYGDFAKSFRAELFNATTWVDMFDKSGAKYVVLTSKHHEGFCNWPSATSFNWNSMEVGPKKDIVGELATAVKKVKGLHFGLYHSMYEWFNPLFNIDTANNFETDYFVQAKTLPELYDIVNKYEPELIWSDGDWTAPDEYWKSKEFLAWLYNDSPVKDIVVVDDRWGKGDMCHHGGYLTCSDRYNPTKIQKRKFENAMTLDKGSWGLSRTSPLSAYLTEEELLTTLVQTVACGGNLLVNVGPAADGTIHPIFEERLSQMGAFLDMAGEGIYSSKPWLVANDSNVWYTITNKTVHAFIFGGFVGPNIMLKTPLSTNMTTVNLLGYTGAITWAAVQGPSGITIRVDNLPHWQLPNTPIPVFRLGHLHASQQQPHEYAQYYSEKAPPTGTQGDVAAIRVDEKYGYLQAGDEVAPQEDVVVDVNTV